MYQMYVRSSAAGLHVTAKPSLNGDGEPPFSHGGSTSGPVYFIIIINVVFTVFCEAI